jgi:hypothetical protein
VHPIEQQSRLFPSRWAPRRGSSNDKSCNPLYSSQKAYFRQNLVWHDICPNLTRG